MARRTRGLRTFVRPAAKTKVWIRSSLAATVVVPGNQLLTVLSAGALLLRPFTIMRTRLVISFLSDQVAASEFAQAVYGRIVVTDSAAAQGTSAVPSPTDEAEASWLVYQPLFQNFLFGTGVGFTELAGQNSFWTVDSKAMRKVGIDDDLVGMLNVGSSVGNEIAIEGRTLIQLH